MNHYSENNYFFKTQSEDGNLIQKKNQDLHNLNPYVDNPLFESEKSLKLSEKQSQNNNDYFHQEDPFANQPFQKLELFWENLTISAKIITQQKKGLCVKKQETNKILLNRLKGYASPGQFTALMGPSGSGKTTLLNFLSGRMYSQNLTVQGNLKFNGEDVVDFDKYGDRIAYVMQDDILYASHTPRDAFLFAAKLRLNISEEERLDKVNKLLQYLGLVKCENTRIGGGLLRGISGGERKRCSIGVELLTNPSMVFLDEPTTGLDSATSLNVINLLKSFAKSGRTIFSTIHQPSSQIFKSFDHLLLLVEGNIIYQGPADKSVDHFASISPYYKCPDLENPADFFMKCMNPDGLKIERIVSSGGIIDDETFNVQQEFQQNLKEMVSHYQETEFYQMIRPIIINQQEQNYEDAKKYKTVNQFIQFKEIFKRSFFNSLKNPLELKIKLLQQIFMSLMCIVTFYESSTGRAEIQNINGLLFFITLMVAMSSMMEAVLMFSNERPLFVREIMNKTYKVESYYFGKSLSEFPFQIIYCTVFLVIVYFACNLSEDPIEKFFKALLIFNLCYFAGVSYGMMVSIAIPNFALAISLIPVLIIPFMLFSGFFINTNNVPYFFKPFEYISIIKYGFQASTLNEFDGRTFICQIPCNPLKEHGFNENLWETIGILFGISFGFRLIAYLGLKILGSPKKLILK